MTPSQVNCQRQQRHSYTPVHIHSINLVILGLFWHTIRSLLRLYRPLLTDMAYTSGYPQYQQYMPVAMGSFAMF